MGGGRPGGAHGDAVAGELGEECCLAFGVQGEAVHAANHSWRPVTTDGEDQMLAKEELKCILALTNTSRSAIYLPS